MLYSCIVQGCNRADGSVQHLALSIIAQLPSLRQLVAAALPDGTQPSQLRSLSLAHCSLLLPAVLSCPFLGHLTSLELCCCTFPDAGVQGGVAAVLQQAPRLHSLSLLGCKGDSLFWPALVNRTGLRHLRLSNNDLSELPPGPYLRSE